MKEAYVEQMCSLAKVSRASYYRDWAQAAPAEADVDRRNEIQKICLSHRRYGYRRAGVELRRRGRVVNHKKVRRLMLEDNLPDGPDQVWVSDITYITPLYSLLDLSIS